MHARLRQCSILDSHGEISAKEAGLGLEEADATRHVHVEAGLNSRDTCMCCTPIGHDIALEIELVLENSIEYLRVLAAITVIKTIVAAHDAGDSGVYRIRKRPEIELVKSFIVDVG